MRRAAPARARMLPARCHPPSTMHFFSLKQPKRLTSPLIACSPCWVTRVGARARARARALRASAWTGTAGCEEYFHPWMRRVLPLLSYTQLRMRRKSAWTLQVQPVPLALLGLDEARRGIKTATRVRLSFGLAVALRQDGVYIYRSYATIPRIAVTSLRCEVSRRLSRRRPKRRATNTPRSARAAHISNTYVSSLDGREIFQSCRISLLVAM